MDIVGVEGTDIYLDYIDERLQFNSTVRHSGLGVVSWICDPVLALGQRFDSFSGSRHLFCCNSLG